MIFFLACAPRPGGDGRDSQPSIAAECEHVSGHVCVVAGTGAAALGAEGVPATESYLYFPHDMTVRSDGVVFLSDWNNHRIRAFTPGGTIETVAGCGMDGDGPPGPALEASFNHPMGIATEGDNGLVIAAWHNHRVVRVDLDSEMLTYWMGDGSGGSGGDGEKASLWTQVAKPSSLTYGPDGTLFISDSGALDIRSVDPEGIVHTVAGTGVLGFSGDGGPATEAQLSNVLGVGAAPASGIDVSDDGRLYVADTGNQRVRVIDLATGIIDTVAGDGTTDVLSNPTDVAVGPDGEVYVADQGHHCIRVLRDGVLDDFAGACGESGSADGDRLDARFDQPWGVDVDGDGNVWVADTFNHVIRVVWR